jgi:hypothetical protein
MEILARIGRNIGEIFSQVDQESQRVEDLGRAIVTWERRRETLEAEKGAAYARLLDCREAELDGQANVDAIAEARAAVADVDERLDATQRKILHLMEELQNAVCAEIAVRHETAPQRVEALETERREILPTLAKALAQAVFLRDRYFKIPDVLPFQLGAVGLPPVFDEELARLKAAAPPEGFLERLYEAQYDLKRYVGSPDTTNYCIVRVKSLLKRMRQEV